MADIRKNKEETTSNQMRCGAKTISPAAIDSFHGLGAAFFPEHHSRSSWNVYVDKIADLGLSFVRMAEFTWDKLEPREGEFDFSWLDEIMSMLEKKGVKVLLCTPTAVPPLWACEKYPEILPVLENGKTFGFGLRRYTCPTSITYTELSIRIVSAMANHYVRNPQILAWQIDNEFGHPFCFCPRCLKSFQSWCRTKYATADRFNSSLCTHFLGQTVQSFEQIPFPTTYPHPGLWQIYHHFSSDKTIECFRRQADTLRSNKVQVPITTNMMITWYGYDHEKMGRHLDVIAGDHYGLGNKNLFGPLFCNEAFTNAYLKGIRHGQAVWFNEFQCGRTGNTPLPGQVRWEVLVQIGLGANLINFFRLDTCPSGGERDAYGLVKAHGRPGRLYHEVKELNAELAKLKPVIEGTHASQAKVAVLYTHANHCEFVRGNTNVSEFSGQFGNGYSIHLSRHYGAVARLNIPCDILYPEDDFTRYELIIAPALFILPKELADKIEDFVATGGKILFSCMSGVADENATIWEQPPPANLSHVFGIEIKDYGTYHPDSGTIQIVDTEPEFRFPPIGEIKWIDELTPVSGKLIVLGKFKSQFFNNLPAITCHPYGKGCAYYLGAILSQDGYNVLYGKILSSLAFKPVLDVQDGLHVSMRTGGKRNVFFINNPGTNEHILKLKGDYEDALTGKTLGAEVTLAPFGVLILIGMSS